MEPLHSPQIHLPAGRQVWSVGMTQTMTQNFVVKKTGPSLWPARVLNLSNNFLPTLKINSKNSAKLLGVKRERLLFLL